MIETYEFEPDVMKEVRIAYKDGKLFVGDLWGDIVIAVKKGNVYIAYVMDFLEFELMCNAGILSEKICKAMKNEEEDHRI